MSLNFPSSTTTVNGARAAAGGVITVLDSTIYPTAVSPSYPVPTAFYRSNRLLCILNVTQVNSATSLQTAGAALYGTTDQALQTGDVVRPYANSQWSQGLVAPPVPTPTYFQDTPDKRAYTEWNFPLSSCGALAGTILILQTQYLAKIIPSQSFTLTNVIVYVGTALSVPVTGHCLVGVYTTDGTTLTLAAYSDDMGTLWGTAGVITMPVLTAGLTGSKLSLVAGTEYFIVALADASTLPKFLMSTTLSAVHNLGLTAAHFNSSVNGSSKTALDATITAASNTNTGALPFWVALS